MGHSRSRDRWKARLRRHKREQRRLAQTRESQPRANGGIGSKVKELARGAAQTVTGLVQAGAQKVQEAAGKD